MIGKYIQIKKTINHLVIIKTTIMLYCIILLALLVLEKCNLI